jgi:prepilin-type N-terminal cleavage/methylation domain-containing protein
MTTHDRSRPRRSFTLTEVLVVIALIALLVGLLLAALGPVQESRRRASSIATMQAFADACNAFHAEHGFYPGLIPERALAYHNHNVAHEAPGTPISATENALLHLLGGAVPETDVSSAEWVALRYSDGWVPFLVHWPDGTMHWFKFNRGRLGDGPVIGGKAYPPYLEVSEAVTFLEERQGGVSQWGRGGGGGGEEDSGEGDAPPLPDLLDGWGTPLLYIRSAGEIGLLAADAHGDVIGHARIKPRFYIDSQWPYTRADAQMRWPDRPEGSLLSTEAPYGSGGFPRHYTYGGLAQIVRHPSLSAPGGDPVNADTPRGSIVIVSAGPDGIFFSAIDGPGSPDRPIGSSDYPYEDFLGDGPATIEEFDDLVISG